MVSKPASAAYEGGTPRASRTRQSGGSRSYPCGTITSGGLRRFREGRAELFSPHDELKGGSYIATQAIEAGAATNFSEGSRQPLQEGAGPSRRPQRRRHGAEQTVTPKLHQQDNANAAANLNGPFVLVAKRVPKLGPCGTLVIDHDTGMEMLETRRYRVRADELQSIDEDGDSAMGSDEYYVCDSSTI